MDHYYIVMQYPLGTYGSTYAVALDMDVIYAHKYSGAQRSATLTNRQWWFGDARKCSIWIRTMGTR